MSNDSWQTRQEERDAADVRTQMKAFLSQNSFPLVGLFFLILISEEWKTGKKDVRERRFLFILFEFCSAYGTVGLSMSSQAWACSGEWCGAARACLMAVMFLGRL